MTVGKNTPRRLPPMTATIPDRKEPKARALTENHTDCRLAYSISTGSNALTCKICEKDGFSKDSLADPKHYQEKFLAEEKSCRCPDFIPWILKNTQINRPSIPPLYLLWRVQKHRDKGTSGLESNEDKKYGI